MTISLAYDRSLRLQRFNEPISGWLHAEHTESLMNLQEIRYLVAVAEHRHFGRAAEACNVSQPTLSSQIRKLENELGVTLLERTNKRVNLTPVGGHILIHARRALDEAAQMEAIAQAARDPLVGPLRLGVIPTLAPYLMPMILGAL